MKMRNTTMWFLWETMRMVFLDMLTAEGQQISFVWM